MKCPRCLESCGAVFKTGEVLDGHALYGCMTCVNKYQNRKGAVKVDENKYWQDEPKPFWFGKGCFNQCCQFEGSKRTDGPDWPKGLTPELIYCSNGNNPLDHEGNCGPELCPLPIQQQAQWLPWPERVPVPQEAIAPEDRGYVVQPGPQTWFFKYEELNLLHDYWLDNPPDRFVGLPWKLMTEDYGEFWKACIAVAFWNGFDGHERKGKSYQDNSFEHAAFQAGRTHRRRLLQRNFGFNRYPTGNAWWK